MIVNVDIPGEPLAQGRPRFARRGQHMVAYDPEKSRSWKGAAQVFMRQAMAGAGRAATPILGAVHVEIEAVFTCPKGEYRKQPVQRRPHTKKRGDADNIAKACLDAATGVLWVDDCQVWTLGVTKWVGAQGEAPGVKMTVHTFETGGEP